jgi:hypothetical protein
MTAAEMGRWIVEGVEEREGRRGRSLKATQFCMMSLPTNARASLAEIIRHVLLLEARTVSTAAFVRSPLADVLISRMRRHPTRTFAGSNTQLF